MALPPDVLTERIQLNCSLGGEYTWGHPMWLLPKILLWAIAAYVALLVTNLVIPLSIGLLADRTFRHKGKNPPALHKPSREFFSWYTWGAIASGFLVGGVIATVLSLLTIFLVSGHWGYQLALIIGFVLASEHGKSLYSPKPATKTRLFGDVGDRLAYGVFSGYLLGATSALLLVNFFRLG